MRKSGITVMPEMGREAEMATMKKPHVGRPPKYKSVEEMQAKIDEYFERCKGHPMTDDEGKPVLDKFGRPIILDAHPPTITGLALALGFSGRQGLLTYQGKKAFTDTVTRAKSKVEQYAEERLFDRDGSNGAKFSLQNNFSGWREDKQKQQQETAENLTHLFDVLNGIKNDE